MRELLLCPPDYYDIEYEINPWMSRAQGAEAVLAQKQWKQLQATLSNLDCKVHRFGEPSRNPTQETSETLSTLDGKKTDPSIPRGHTIIVEEAASFGR